MIGGVILSLFIGAVISYLASEAPDGLERVAEDLGFASRGEGGSQGSEIMPDYRLPGIENRFLSGAAAGALGVGAVLLACLTVGKILGSWKPRKDIGKED